MNYLIRYLSKDVNGIFKHIDPLTNSNVLSEANVKEINQLLIHVNTGCLTDPWDTELYYKDGLIFLIVGICQKTGLQKYRCARGSSSLEGVHRLLVRNCSYALASYELIDAHLAVHRHRHNIRAAEKNRPGFPRLGHFAHELMDHIIDLTEKIYGKKLYDWWPKTFGQIKARQTFGFLPINDADKGMVPIEKLPRDLEFLALKQNSKVPYLPIQSREEKKIYADCIASYLAGINYDFQKFSEDWNRGTLKSISKADHNAPDGRKITMKLPRFLESYFKQSVSKRLQNQANGTLNSIRQTSNEIIAVGQPKPISNPMYFNFNFRNLVHGPSLLAPGIVSAAISHQNHQIKPSFQEKVRSRRSCNNCALSSCIGGTGRGGKGLKCKQKCSKGCLLVDCHGGKVIPCLAESQ